MSDLSRKLQIFPTPVYCAPLLTGLRLELCISAWSKGRILAARRSNKF